MADFRPDTLPLDPTENNGGRAHSGDRPHELTREETAVVIREVPDEPPAIHRGAPRAGMESWIIALAFGVVYGIIGYFFLTDGRIASFESLNRLNEAYVVWWNAQVGS